MKIKLIHVDDLVGPEASLDLILKNGYYPLNKNAKDIAKFLEKDTLSGYDVRIIRELGHNVEFVPSESLTN